MLLLLLIAGSRWRHDSTGWEWNAYRYTWKRGFKSWHPGFIAWLPVTVLNIIVKKDTFCDSHRMERSDSKNVGFFFRIVAGLCKTWRTNYRVRRPVSWDSGSLIFSSNAKVTTSSTLNGVSRRHLADILYEFFCSKVFTRGLTRLRTFAALISWNNG